jgi:uncharacterized coiled-coil DUF342 family protein
MDEKTRLSLQEFEALVKEIKGNCDKCASEYRERLLFADFYVEQLKDLHGNMLKTLREVRDERRQLQGTVARLMSVYERLEALNDKQKQGQSQCKW